MKKLILVCVLILLAGCATVTYEKADGTKLKVSRPIFAAVSAGVTTFNGDIVTVNANTSVSIDQLSQTAMAGYAKYMSGGLASTSTQTPSVTLVPKAEAQATPPPAEVVR